MAGTPAHTGVSGTYDNIVPLIIVTAYVLSAEASIFMCDPPQWSAKDTHYRYRLSKLYKYPAQYPLTQMHPPQVLRRVSQHTPSAPDLKIRLNRSLPLEIPSNSHMWISTHAKAIITISHPYPYTW